MKSGGTKLPAGVTGKNRHGDRPTHSTRPGCRRMADQMFLGDAARRQAKKKKMRDRRLLWGWGMVLRCRVQHRPPLFQQPASMQKSASRARSSGRPGLKASPPGGCEAESGGRCSLRRGWRGGALRHAGRRVCQRSKEGKAKEFPHVKRRLLGWVSTGLRRVAKQP